MKAKEMFEELGYIKSTNNEYELTYKHKAHFNEITFCLEGEKVTCDNGNGKSILINKYELQAINQQCKELGWLEDK